MFSVSPCFGVSQRWENEVHIPRVPGSISHLLLTNAFSKEPILEDLKSYFGNQVSLPAPLSALLWTRLPLRGSWNISSPGIFISLGETLEEFSKART